MPKLQNVVFVKKMRKLQNVHNMQNMHNVQHFPSQNIIQYLHLYQIEEQSAKTTVNKKLEGCMTLFVRSNPVKARGPQDQAQQEVYHTVKKHKITALL